MSNYPDNCRSNDPYAPWNAIDPPDVAVDITCLSCGEEWTVDSSDIEWEMDENGWKGLERDSYCPSCDRAVSVWADGDEISVEEYADE